MNNAGDVLRLTAIRKSYNIGTPVEAGDPARHQPDRRRRRVHRADRAVRLWQEHPAQHHRAAGAPTSGEVEIAGNLVSYRDDDTLTRLRSQTLGFVFQFHHLLPAFSALENVLMPQVIAGKPHHRGIAPRGPATAGVGHSARRRKTRNRQSSPAACSSGLPSPGARPSARHWCSPTSLPGNLDTRTAADIFAMLRTFNRDFGTSFPIVTHDPRLAATCDRRVTLADGQIVADER